MIITRTPYRVSFFGGGTDISAWYSEHGGAVLSTAIDHYSWITARWMPPFFEHRHRIVWSLLERPDFVEHIEHPAVRALLREMNFNSEPEKGLDITVLSDLPARAGLGSSSTFAVGLLQALHTLRGQPLAPMDLAKAAIHLERVVLAEAGGIQDQIPAAFGGLNEIRIETDGSFNVQPLNLHPDTQRNLENHCLLFFSGQSRSAAAIETAKLKGIASKPADMAEMHKQVDIGLRLLRENDMAGFGGLLHEAWMLKRGLASAISTDVVDSLYARARAAGALGGKLLGAGGGGFFLVFANPEHHAAIKTALSELLYIPFKVTPHGCTVVVNTPREYESSVHQRRDDIYMPKPIIQAA